MLHVVRVPGLDHSILVRGVNPPDRADIRGVPRDCYSYPGGALPGGAPPKNAGNLSCPGGLSLIRVVPRLKAAYPGGALPGCAPKAEDTMPG